MRKIAAVLVVVLGLGVGTIVTILFANVVGIPWLSNILMVPIGMLIGFAAIRVWG